MVVNENQMGISIFADNFEAERAEHEYQKYGRVPHREAVQYPVRDRRHSIEPAYGQYDRPINEVV